LGDDKSLIYELILALVLLWLLVNSIKKENPKEKRPIDFFLLFYLNLIIILLFCLFLVLNVVTA